jgi:hypothetical protein
MTMPTREEIIEVANKKAIERHWTALMESRDMLRRIADALKDGIVVPKEKIRQWRADLSSHDKRFRDAARADMYMLAAANDRAENCEHSWATDGIGPTKCLKCGDTSDACSRHARSRQQGEWP